MKIINSKSKLIIGTSIVALVAMGAVQPDGGSNGEEDIGHIDDGIGTVILGLCYDLFTINFCSGFPIRNDECPDNCQHFPAVANKGKTFTKRRAVFTTNAGRTGFSLDPNDAPTNCIYEMYDCGPGVACTWRGTEQLNVFSHILTGNNCTGLTLE